VLSLARQVREDQLWAGAGTGKGWSVDGKVLVTKVGGQSDQRVAQSKGSSLGWGGGAGIGKQQQDESAQHSLSSRAGAGKKTDEMEKKFASKLQNPNRQRQSC
jgi:hypothetical protein